ncbi:MAG: flagellar motor switch protein FliM [Rhodocyclaceae bacterium]|nr:flagellar motor switch protein FliM [Rhodocyclaceae bacterium]
MSQEFLSQEEVDALLRGVTGETEESSAPQEEAQGGVRPYDLGRQERIVRGRMPTLELINERFARNLRFGLFNYMHRNAEIACGPVRVQKYADFIRNLVVPTNLNLIQVKPLRGTGLLVFDPNLVFLVVDNMFGSDGRFHVRVEGRDFTATEQRIILGLLSVVFAEYEKAWQPVFEIKFEYVRSEMNTQFANIATPSEIVVATTFTIEIAGNAAEMHVCLPYSMIEPIRDILYSTMHSEQAESDQRWTTLLRKQLLSAEVELVATLGGTTLTLGEVKELKVGDIVPIEIPDTIHVKVDGVPLLACRYGVSNGQYAIKIESFLSPEEVCE